MWPCRLKVVGDWRITGLNSERFSRRSPNLLERVTMLLMLIYIKNVHPGYRRIMIETDSEYVVDSYIPEWERGLRRIIMRYNMCILSCSCCSQRRWTVAKSWRAACFERGRASRAGQFDPPPYGRGHREWIAFWLVRWQRIPSLVDAPHWTIFADWNSGIIGIVSTKGKGRCAIWPCGTTQSAAIPRRKKTENRQRPPQNPSFICNHGSFTTFNGTGGCARQFPTINR